MLDLVADVELACGNILSVIRIDCRSANVMLAIVARSEYNKNIYCSIIRREIDAFLTANV